MKYIVYSKQVVEPSVIMIDDEDLIGRYTWEEAKKQIDLLNSLSYKGFSNWRLPSKEELSHLYINKEDIGGFASAFCWSSSESNNYRAWIQGFGDGSQLYTNKNNSLYVRAVRDI